MFILEGGEQIAALTNQQLFTCSSLCTLGNSNGRVIKSVDFGGAPVWGEACKPGRRSISSVILSDLLSASESQFLICKMVGLLGLNEVSRLGIGQIRLSKW